MTECVGGPRPGGRSLVRWALERLVGFLPPPRVIFDRDGVSPYLSRWYLIGEPPPTDETGQTLPSAGGPRFGVFLHRFHRSDQDAALHNHPWEWARALILAGGYVEERRVDGPGDRSVRIRRADSDGITRFCAIHGVSRHIRRPGSWVHINADDYHRVDLLEDDSWSLFIAGPKVASWGFWDRHTGETLPWREFIAKARGLGWDIPAPRGRPEGVAERAARERINAESKRIGERFS